MPNVPIFSFSQYAELRDVVGRVIEVQMARAECLVDGHLYGSEVQILYPFDTFEKAIAHAKHTLVMHLERVGVLNKI